MLFVSHFWRQHSIHSESLTSLGGTKQIFSDGRAVEIHIAGNELDETKVVIVAHIATVDPERNVLKPGVVYSSHDPIGDLKSAYTLTTHYPPDPDISGLWVDGVERDIRDGLTVVYISDLQQATDVIIFPEVQESFLKDAREMDPLEFIGKWMPSHFDEVSGLETGE